MPQWGVPASVPNKLRKLERHQLRRGDEQFIVLRDPLGVSETIALPAVAVDILDLLNGQRTPAQVRQSLLMRGKLDVSTQEIADLVADLRDNGMLDDEVFRAKFATILREFLASPTLQPRHAGMLYPDDPTQLGALFDDVFAAPHKHFGTPAVGAVVCPHHPPTQVADTLRATLDQLPLPGAVDCIVVLATDHAPGLLPYVTTAKKLVSPLGASPVSELVETLCEDVPWVTREEIRFRQATSLEFQVLLLHRIYGASCPPVLPVLCGQTVLSRAQQPQVDEFLAAMERLTSGRRVLFWCAAECSHAGAAFGGRATPADYDTVEARDRQLLAELVSGRPEQLGQRCREHDPICGRPSGGAVLTTLANLVELGTRGDVCSYKLLTPPGGDGVSGIAGVKLWSP